MFVIDIGIKGANACILMTLKRKRANVKENDLMMRPVVCCTSNGSEKEQFDERFVMSV